MMEFYLINFGSSFTRTICAVPRLNLFLPSKARQPTRTISYFYLILLFDSLSANTPENNELRR
jgi:hypothetical protein